MSFSVSQRTLEHLGWARVLARLQELTRTPGGRRAVLGTPPGEPRDEIATPGDRASTTLLETPDGAVSGLLQETGEALAILSEEGTPPLGGVNEVADSLGHARRGGILTSRELLDLGSTLAATREVRHFIGSRADQAPRLAHHAEDIADFRALELEIEDTFTPDGEVRNEASAVLARTRAEVRGLESSIQSNLGDLLRNPTVRERLSDRYFTIRNDRYVLPVRAESRRGFGGIVHDASSTGATLFIEPQELVEPNNRLKQAEMEIEREIRRILRELSGEAALVADEIERALYSMTAIDLAFARGMLAEQTDATCPEVLDEGVIHLPQLRHPLLDSADAVPNDIGLGRGHWVLVLSGPNAGGKTVAMTAVALAVLFVRAGLFVPAGPGSRVDHLTALYADIGDEQDIRQSLSTFSAHLSNLAAIVDRADDHSLVILDEIGVGTDPLEGAALAQATLEALAGAHSLVLATTHYSLLKEMADVDSRFENASVQFDEQTLEPTYRLKIGTPGASSATNLATRMGLRSDVVERAIDLLERDDRPLDRMLTELAGSRDALERERREARQARLENEAERDAHQKLLSELRQKRVHLFESMRSELVERFKDAHAQIAGVIRDLQRGGTAPDAAHARERILALEERARDHAASESPAPEPEETGTPVDWQTARVGDRVRLLGGARASLTSLPDRRGRVGLQTGSARIEVPADRVLGIETDSADRTQAPSRPPTITHSQPSPESDSEWFDSQRCDLRGLRVDEALDGLAHAIDRAIARNHSQLLIIHGVGTGALREAVRTNLASNPLIARFVGAEPDEGGPGTTVASLR